MYRFTQSEERLRRVFEEGFSVRDIASSLASFDGDFLATGARAVMTERGYNVAGVRIKGLIAGYVSREGLDGGRCRDHLQSFTEEEVLPDTASFSSVVKALDDRPRIFVKVFDEVGGLVTRTDLEKPPVRMWLFGIITLVEMTSTRIIQVRFPDENWKKFIGENRLSKAEALLKERRRRGQEVHLLDCLQFSDKGQVLMKNEDIRELLEIPSRREGEARVKMLESLRNNLAHSQDIVSHDWVAIVRLADNLDRTLSRLKDLTGEPGA